MLFRSGLGDASVFAGLGGRIVGAPSAPAATGDVGVSLSHVNVGLALLTEVVTSGTPRTYTALRASGVATLVGVSGFELTGSLGVEVNSASTGNAVDFTRLPGGKLTVPTGPTTPAIDLAYTKTTLRAFGAVTLSLDQFAYITGSFAFEKVADQDVTLEGPGNIHGPVGSLQIGATNVNAFFGVGGPYWQANADGTVGLRPDSGGAMGLAISNVTFGLALMTPTATSALHGQVDSLFALKATGNVALVGISGFTASMTNVTVEIDQIGRASCRERVYSSV